MKKTLFRVLSIALATAIGFSASSCSDDDPVVVPTTMTLTADETNPANITPTSITITITPSENTAKYSYAIGKGGDLAAFTNGTLAGIVNVTGNQPTTVTFSDLDPETEYMIFARGEDANQIFGEVATQTITTLGVPEINITIGEVTTSTIKVTFTPNQSTANYSYAIGTEGDLAAFTNGTLAGIVNITGNQPTTLTFSGLDEETEYMIFARGKDATQISGDVTTQTATTLVATAPEVTVEFGAINAVAVEITTTPNSLVSDYYGLVISKEMYQDFVDLFADGDKIAFMQMMADFGEATILSTTKTRMWETNGTPGYEYIFAVLVNDMNGDPYGDVMEVEFQSPPFNPDLQTAGASITVSQITASSARIKITPDANAAGFYAGILTKVNYEAAISDEQQLRDELAFYGFCSFVEDDDTWGGMDPGTDYVMVVSPFNANGIQGYGPLVIKEFTTLAGSPAPNNSVKHKTVLKSETGKKITRNELIGKKVK